MGHRLSCIPITDPTKKEGGKRGKKEKTKTGKLEGDAFEGRTERKKKGGKKKKKKKTLSKTC